MEVICLEDEAFYALVEAIVSRLKAKEGIKEDKWISTEEAMPKLAFLEIPHGTNHHQFLMI